MQDRDGTISIEPAGPFSVDARNDKGDMELTLPPNASATVDGHTHNGDIVTDYGLAVSGEEDKTVSGRIGSGAAHIQLSTDNGDLHIKKGSAFPPAPHRLLRRAGRAQRTAPEELKTAAPATGYAVTRPRLEQLAQRAREVMTFRARFIFQREELYAAFRGIQFPRGSISVMVHAPVKVITVEREYGSHGGGVCARSGCASGLAAAGFGAGGRRGAHGRRGSEAGRQVR